MTYMSCMNTALNIAVSQKIINENPFKNMPRHKKLKRKDVERTFLTIEDLNKLANAKTNIHQQPYKIARILSEDKHDSEIRNNTAI